jgi:hypothetical protein
MMELVGEVEAHLVRLMKPTPAVFASKNAAPLPRPSDRDTVLEMDTLNGENARSKIVIPRPVLGHT